MKAFHIFLTIGLIAAAGLVYYNLKPEPAPPPPEFPAPKTPEEAEFVREAHRIGTRLYAVSKRAADQTPMVELQQERLKPVYAQIEELIFQRLSQHSNYVTSIVVFYQDPDIQCTIYVKNCSEEEMKKIKTTADTCVGRIVENLPIVRYLVVRHDEAYLPLQFRNQPRHAFNGYLNLFQRSRKATTEITFTAGTESASWNTRNFLFVQQLHSELL